MHQTRIGLHVIHIPPQLAVFLDNAVLLLRLHRGLLGIGFGLDHGRIQHLAVIAELVVRSGQQVVGLGDPVLLVARQHAAGTGVVVVTIDQHQTAVHGQAILHVEHAVAVGGLDAAEVSEIVDHLAVGAEVVDVVAFLDVVAVDSNRTDAGEHVGVITEVVGRAVDFRPLTLEELGAGAVAGTLGVGHPGAGGDTVLVEDVGDAVDRLLADSHFLGGGVGIAPAGILAFDHLPAGNDLASEQEVQLAVSSLYDTAAGCNMTAGALQHIAINHIAVAGSGHHGAPFHHGLTGLAVGTPGIASLVAGGSQRQGGQFRVMGVPGIRDVGTHQLGLDRCAAVDRRRLAVAVLKVTGQNLVINGNHRIIGRLGRFLIRHVVPAIPGPDAHRQGQQGLLTGQGAVFGTGQGDGQHVLHGVDVRIGALGRHSKVVTVRIQQLVLHLVAGGDAHAVQLPGVGGIQLNVGNEGFHLRGVIGLDVHIVEGIVLGCFARIIAASQVNLGVIVSGIHLEDEGLLGNIALLVGHLEGNLVLAVCQGHIAQRGENIADKLGFHQHTVNIDLAGSSIQAGRVDALGALLVLRVLFHLGREADAVGRDDHFAIHLNRFVSGGVGDLADDGLVTVRHSCAVVQGDVVNVESQVCSRAGLDVGTDEGGAPAVALIRRIGSLQVIVTGYVNRGIHPAIGGNVLFRRTVQVLANTANGGEHEVILLAAQAAVCILDIELGLEGQAGSAFGNVNPHAQGRCILAIRHITQHLHALDVEDHVVAPACKGCISKVHGHAQRMVAILDLAIALVRNKGIQGDLLIELTRQRGRANQRIVHAVVEAPLLGIHKAHEAMDGTIFKIPAGQDLGALAELNVVVQHNFRIMLVGRDDIHSMHGFIFGSRERRTVGSDSQGTGIRIGGFPGEILGGEVHGGVVLVLGSEHLHFNGRRLAIGQHGRFLCHADRHGIGDRESEAGRENSTFVSISNAAQCVSDGHNAFLAGGGEHTVLDGAEGVVRQAPLAAGGHGHLITDSVDGHSLQGVNSIGHHIVVLRQHFHAAELGGNIALCRQDDGVDGGTLSAVRGHGTHDGSVVARALGNEGGGTAAIAVDRVDAAQSQHQFAHLVVGQAGGNRAVTAVAVDDHQRAVSLDAQHGAGGVRGGALHFRGSQLTILDQPAEVGRNDGTLVALQGLAHGEQLAGAVPVHREVGLGTLMIRRSAQHLTLVHHETIGHIAVVGQSGVHGADNLVAQGVLVVLDGLGQLLRLGQLILQGISSSICFRTHGIVVGFQHINAVVARQHIHLGGVHFEDMDNLTVIAGGIIQDDFTLNGAGQQREVLFLGDPEVVLADAGLIPAGAAALHSQGRGGRLVQLGQEGNLSSVLGQLFLGHGVHGHHGVGQIGVASGQFLVGHPGQHVFDQHPVFAFVLAVVVGNRVRKGALQLGGQHHVRRILLGRSSGRDRGHSGGHGGGGHGGQGLLVQGQQVAADEADGALVIHAVPDVAVVGLLGAGHGQDRAGLLHGADALAGSGPLLADADRVRVGPGDDAVLGQGGHVAALLQVDAGLLHQHVQVDVVVKLGGTDGVGVAGDSAVVIAMNDSGHAVVDVGDDADQLLAVDLDQRKVADGGEVVAAGADQRTHVIHFDAQVLVGAAVGELLLRQTSLGSHPVDEERSPVRLGRTVPFAVQADAILLGVAQLGLGDGDEVIAPLASQLHCGRLGSPVGFGIRIFRQHPGGEHGEDHREHQQHRNDAVSKQLVHSNPSFLVFMISAPGYAGGGRQHCGSSAAHQMTPGS